MKEELVKDGWNLTEEGIEFCKKEFAKSGKKPLARDVKNIALNTDITNIGEGCIPEDLKHGKLKKLPKCLTLQITKVKNLTAPQANQTSQHAPRMLQIYMSDGHRTCQAIEHQRVNQLSLDTAPGTKVQISPEVEISASGVFLISPSTFKILGGKVDNLYKKWLASKEACGYSRDATSGNSPPPPFVAFGKFIEQRYSSGTKTDKLLGQVEEQAAANNNKNEEDDEFESQRKAQIEKVKKENEKKFSSARPSSKFADDAMATSGRFMHQRGGRGGHQRAADYQQNGDSNSEEVKVLISMGFDARVASRQLRQHDNNLEATIDSLLNGGGGNGDRTTDHRRSSQHDDIHPRRGGGRGDRGGYRGGRGGNRDDFGRGRGSRDDHRGGRGGGRDDFGGDRRGRGGRGRGGRGRRRDDDDDGDVTRSKGGATLFDFLQPKITTTTATNSTAPSSSGVGEGIASGSWADEAAAEEDRQMKYAIQLSKVETQSFGAGYGGYPYNQQDARKGGNSQQDVRSQPSSSRQTSSGGSGMMHDRFARYNNNNDKQRNKHNNRQNNDKQFDSRRTNSESSGQHEQYNNGRKTNYDNNKHTSHDNNRQSNYDNNRQSNYDNNRQTNFDNNRQTNFNNRQTNYDNSRKTSYENNRQTSFDNSRQTSFDNSRQTSFDNNRQTSFDNSRQTNRQQYNRPAQFNDRQPFNNKQQQHKDNSRLMNNSNYKQQTQYDDRQSQYNNNRQQQYNDRPNSNRQAGEKPYNNKQQQNRPQQQHHPQQQQRHPDIAIYQPPTARHTMTSLGGDFNRKMTLGETSKLAATTTGNTGSSNDRKVTGNVSSNDRKLGGNTSSNDRKVTGNVSSNDRKLGGNTSSNDRKVTGNMSSNDRKLGGNTSSSGSKFRVGDQVMACYWEDQKYYEARVVDVHESNSFLVVEFSEYGNCEEVHINDIQRKPQQHQVSYLTIIYFLVVHRLAHGLYTSN